MPRTPGIDCVLHQLLAAFAALLDLLTAALDALGLLYLASDGVAPGLLLVGIPACAFLVALSATLWRNAVCLGMRTPIYLHLLLAVAGVAIGLVGEGFADQLAFMAAMNASPDDFYSIPSEVAFAAAVGWPLLWAAAAVAIWALARFSSRPDRPVVRQVRSVSAALAAGFAFSIPALLTALGLASFTTPTSQSCCPRDYTFPARHGGQLDVVIFLYFVIVSLGFFAVALVAAARRARPAPR